MAKYRIRNNNRFQPHCDSFFWKDKEDTKEDSGVQLDEPSSPQSKTFNHSFSDVAGELTNRDSSQHNHTDYKQSTKQSSTKQSSLSPTEKVGGFNSTARVEDRHRMGTLSKDEIHDKHKDSHESAGSQKRQSKPNCDKGAVKARNSQDMNVEFTVTLSLDEDEGLEIQDLTTDLPRGHNFEGNKKDEGSEDSSTDSSTEISDIKELDSVDGLFDHADETESAKRSGKHSEKKEKDSKKRRFRKMIGRPLRRSQSAGCETDLQVPEHALFLGEKLCVPEKREDGGICKRAIHKTTSADAAMMASEVLPVDSTDTKSKPKTSLAKNVKRKLQALRRRNTDSSLGVTIMKLHGPTKVSQADTIEWSKSFESLLNDKTGLELFRDFLKSEFSEENIEFWIACEEFKTIRTNKLAQKAEQIYSDYIAVKAPKQVNLDSKTRLETVTNLDNPTRDMYKSAQKRIQHLMEKDPYPRFLESEIFLQLSRQCSRSDSR